LPEEILARLAFSAAGGASGYGIVADQTEVLPVSKPSKNIGNGSDAVA
jgi:hypothetical protein